MDSMPERKRSMRVQEVIGVVSVGGLERAAEWYERQRRARAIHERDASAALAVYTDLKP
jgi:hypothetical protein